ncbi:Protein of unknown function, partial [Gryllus bimaculatus]
VVKVILLVNVVPGGEIFDLVVLVFVDNETATVGCLVVVAEVTTHNHLKKLFLLNIIKLNIIDLILNTQHSKAFSYTSAAVLIYVVTFASYDSFTVLSTVCSPFSTKMKSENWKLAQTTVLFLFFFV